MAFGLKQLKSETPLWAKWVFRVTLIVTTVLSFWIAGTNLISDNIKLEIIQALKTLDVLVFAISKLFGINIEEAKEKKEELEHLIDKTQDNTK